MSDTYSVFDAGGARIASGVSRADALDKWQADGRAGTVAREIEDGPETPTETAGLGTIVAPAAPVATKPTRTRTRTSRPKAATTK